MARALSAILGSGLVALGWVALVLGSLLALVVGFYEIVGYGDHDGHFAWEDVQIPAAVLAFGVLMVWLGRTLRRAVRPPPAVPPPG